MADITRNRWNRGWVPDADFVAGPKDGLRRMKNLQLDELGNVSLVRGQQLINSTRQLSGFVHDLYSKTFTNSTGSGKYRYAAMGDGRIARAKDLNFASAAALNSNIVLSGGSTVNACFGTTGGLVLVSSGTQRKRDEVTSVNNLGMTTPSGGPGLTSNNTGVLDASGSWRTWSLILGTGIVSGSDYILGRADTTENTVIFQNIYGSPVNIPINTVVGTVDFPRPEDSFRFNVRLRDGFRTVDKVRIEFLLQIPNAIYGSTTNDVDDYYYYEWPNNDSSPIKDGWNALDTTRQQFERVGTNGALDWRVVKAVKVYVYFKQPNAYDVIVNELRFVGGNAGPINGIYDYIQVNVYNNGNYVGKSQRSPIAYALSVLNGTVTVQPNTASSAETTEIWVFRRNTEQTPDIPLQENAILNKWYRVLVITKDPVKGTFLSATDNTTDTDALLLNETFDDTLTSVKYLQDEILDIVTDYFGRTIYATIKDLLVSDFLNPDLIDPKLTLRLSGNTTSKNLWARKLSAGVIVVGTSEEIYEVSGTLTVSPDGSTDILIRPLGINKPPICKSAVVHENVIYYVANDGVRALSGANSVLVTEGLHTLFQGYAKEIYLSGTFGRPIQPVAIVPQNNAFYPMAVAHGKLFITCPLVDGSRDTFVYSIKDKYWYEYFTDQFSMFTEEDGTLIAGLGGGSGNYVVQLDTPTTQANITRRSAEFTTFYDDDGLPRNRKDTFSLKIKAFSDAPIDIFVSKDGSENFIQIGSQTFTPTGSSLYAEKIITIAGSIGLGKNFAVRLSGTGFYHFTVYEFSIEYLPRPEQLTYFRIPPSNLGTKSRKRFVNYAFEIDTLGQTCEFTPIVDGVTGTVSNLSFNRKATHIHYFDSETVGTDISGVICGFFEFYGLNSEEIISEKMPNPTTYLVIPQEDFGTPNRKRHSSYKFIINTRGSAVTFTPRLDEVNYPGLTFTTSEKQVVEYFFTTSTYQDPISINIGGTLSSATTPKVPFEYYGSLKPQDVEVLPPRLKEFTIPYTDYGVPNRKRHSSYKFQINTNGANVQFTPKIDGTSYTPATYNTAERRTVEYFFRSDTIGIDIGGFLESIQDTPFEFYGSIKPQDVEVLPPRLKEFRIPENNYGAPTMKRIRVMPMEINTNGVDVIFTAIVDGIPQVPTSIFNTSTRKTVFHYFDRDVIGVDFSGELKVRT